MKRVLFALLVVMVMSMTMATPALAAPPPEAGKGTAENDGLWNAFSRLLEVGSKTRNYFPAAVIDWLYYWQAGPPPWFAPANYK
ncbi:hypothetical protein ACFLVJ_01515 [Chloroflexota bacterium]